MFNDFRTFLARGNVLDLAVGIIIGAAFTTVVKSFVDDILMPPIGMLTGGADFSELYVSLSGERFASRAEALEAGAPIVSYGAFINNIIAFLITATAVFLLVRAATRMQRRQAVSPPAPTEKDCPFCISRIPLAAVRCPACTSELTAVPVVA